MVATLHRASAVMLALLQALHADETSFEGSFLLKFSSEGQIDLCLGDTGHFDPCVTEENQHNILWRAIPVDTENGEFLPGFQVHASCQLQQTYFRSRFFFKNRE